MGHRSSKFTRAGDWVHMPDGDRYMVVATRPPSSIFSVGDMGLCVDLKNPRMLLKYGHYNNPPDKVWVMEKGEGIWTSQENIEDVCNALEIIMQAQSVDNDACRKVYVALYNIIRKLKKGEIERGLEDLNDFFKTRYL